jgi:hypothetical protein
MLVFGRRAYPGFLTVVVTLVVVALFVAGFVFPFLVGSGTHIVSVAASAGALLAWSYVRAGGVRSVAGGGVRVGSRCVPAAGVEGLALEWRAYEALPAGRHVPVLVLKGGGTPWVLKPFASFWPGPRPTRFAVRRAERLAAFLGVPFLGVLPGPGGPGRSVGGGTP